MPQKRFSIQDRVRWSDVDRAGIIYFGSYVRFFEIAETEMYRAVGLPYSTIFDVLDIYAVRAQFHCDFKSPAFLDDLLTVELWVTNFGETSLRLEFEIHRGPGPDEHAYAGVRDLLVTGHCVLVTVDHAKYRPCRVPDRLRVALAEFYHGTE